MNVLELGSKTRWTEIRKRNRLIDRSMHLNRRALELARDELEQRGIEMLDDIQRSGAKVGDLVRKVSKRSVRSRKGRGTSSGDELVVTAEPNPIARVGTGGVGHDAGHHSEYPADMYKERECFMGQTVPEEADESSSAASYTAGDEEHAGYFRRPSQEHHSHMMPKVRPYVGFEAQELRGSTEIPEGYVVDTESSRREHQAHMQPKVRPADPAMMHLAAHGSHMGGSKVKPAYLGHQQHSTESKVRPAKLGDQDSEPKRRASTDSELPDSHPPADPGCLEFEDPEHIAYGDGHRGSKSRQGAEGD
jgi:hypothetical protein